MEKRGGSLKNIYVWVCKNPTRKSIIAILNKPKLISEIAKDVSKRLDLKKVKISSYIKELENFNIIRCLTPKLGRGKPGNVFGLTRKGIKIASMIYSQINENFCYRKPKGMDWENYGWCLTGTQKKTVLASLEQKPFRQKEIVKKTREFYADRNKNKGITRQNLHDILQKMLEKYIVEKEEKWIVKIKKREKPETRYRLSEKGLRIRTQFLS